MLLLWSLILLAGCVGTVPVQKDPPYWTSGNVVSSQGSDPRPRSVKTNVEPQSAPWGQGFVGRPEYGVMDPYAPSTDTEAAEPFFTDVSALKPVYTSSSRSRYQRGRLVFAQTRYTPGEQVYPSMPVVYSYSQRSREQSGPADPPKKGGF